jgi:hypothetical protein
VPIESEEFFATLVSRFAGSKSDFLRYVKENLPSWFRFVSQPPRWLQEAEWQFSRGVPMVFVGQVDVSAGAQWFHDDASFFVFWDPETGETKVTIQVA